MSKHPGERPSLYTPELAARICKLIATHAMGLRRICDKYDDLPNHSTIYEWIFDHPGFADMYMKARKSQAHLLLDETINVANSDDKDDDDNLIRINRDKLKVDTYKFTAVRLNPRDYGDKHLDDDTKKALDDMKEQVQQAKDIANKCLAKT